MEYMLNLSCCTRIQTWVNNILSAWISQVVTPTLDVIGFVVAWLESSRPKSYKRCITITILLGKNLTMTSWCGLSEREQHLTILAYKVSLVAQWETLVTSLREWNQKKIKLLCTQPFMGLAA